MSHIYQLMHMSNNFFSWILVIVDTKFLDLIVIHDSFDLANSSFMYE